MIFDDDDDFSLFVFFASGKTLIFGLLMAIPIFPIYYSGAEDPNWLVPAGICAVLGLACEVAHELIR